MKLYRAAVAALAAFVLMACGAAEAATILQGGPWTPGHVPMYVGQGSSQPVVQDSGPASGGDVGLGLSELLLVARGTGTPPYAGQGTGPLGANFCSYDAPTTNASGYHYLCLSPNAQGGGLIAFGAGGAASQIPFYAEINGQKYPFPFTMSGTGIVGPTTTVVGDAMCWGNTTGTLASDCGAGASPFLLIGNNTAIGDNVFEGSVTLPSGTAATNLGVATCGVGKLVAGTANGVLCWPGAVTSTGNDSEVQIAVSAAPTYTFPEALATEFSGDFSNTLLPLKYTVSGSATLGQPSTGYQWNPAVTPVNVLTFNSSGWNQSASSSAGRTGFANFRSMVAHNGQGDSFSYYGFCQMSQAKSGATNFLANPACTILGGDVAAGADGEFLQGVGDVNLKDNGHAAAAAGVVLNLNRTSLGNSVGQLWMGYLANGVGTQQIDVAYLASGKVYVGLDTTQASLASGAAINLAQTQKIVFNSTATALAGISWYGNSIGNAYMDLNSSGILEACITGGTTCLKVDVDGYVKSTGGLQANGNLIGANAILTTASVATTSSNIGLGNTTTAASSCGSLSGASGCLKFYVGSTAHYLPYY